MAISVPVLKCVINRNINVAQNKRRSDVERKLAERVVLIAFKRIDKLYTAKTHILIQSRDAKK
jgi:hypothetical protein